MPVIVFDQFGSGLDLRRGASVADATRLRVLKNAYVTTGKTIQKRPGLTKVTTLETGTKGLRSGISKLNTFFESGTITHANPLFRANKIQYPGSSSAVTKVWYCDSFGGYLYVAAEYANGDVRHHWLDDPGAWAATTVYALNALRRPVTANGLQYKVTTGGTSAGVEPTWPTTYGATVVDGTVTWTCVGTAIADTNCPHGRGVTKTASKVWSTKKTSPFDVVKFCADSAPRDWTATSDAGFLPVALRQENAQDCLSLGQFQDQLVAFFADGAQLWSVDPDPALNVIKQRIYGVGTRHPNSPASFADDVFFLADQGVRSVTVNQMTANLQDTDIGSPVDSIITTYMVGVDPICIYAAPLGQLWVCLGSTVFVYSFSRTSKVSAWSFYEFPFIIDDITILNNQLYLRNDDDVYLVDKTKYLDENSLIDVEVTWPFLDFKSPSGLKMIHGADIVCKGSATLTLGIDPNNEELRTIPIEIDGDMRPGTLTPLEVVATGISPSIKHARNEDFRIDLISFHYEKLGNL